jgi:hypothetical protein
LEGQSKAALEMFGGIDILVNCGGISVRHDNQPFFDYPKTVIVTFLFTKDCVTALSETAYSNKNVKKRKIYCSWMPCLFLWAKDWGMTATLQDMLIPFAAY